MKTTKIKLQYAVAITKEFVDRADLKTYYSALQDIDDVEWFDREDEAVFNFAKTYSSWEELPNNIVIKRVVKI